MIGDHHGGAELAEGAQPCEQRAGEGRARQTSGRLTRQNTARGPMAERRRHVLEHRDRLSAKADRAAMIRKGAATKVSASTMPMKESVSAPCVSRPSGLA